MTRRTNTKSRLLSSAVALTLLSATTLLQSAHASLSCSSPSGSYQVGDSVRLELSGTSWWPRLQDVYSITANVYCSSGSGTVASMSISNGDSWTIPESALGRCSEDKMYVQFTGQIYDIAHLAHILPYWESCGALSISPAPPKPTTTKEPTVPPTQPPTQQPPATTTKDPTVPTGVPPTTTNPPTQQPPTATTTTSYSPIYTTTYTLVPTVISGTSTFISVTTVIVVTPTALPPVLTSASTTNGAIAPPDSSQLPGLPPSPGGNNNNSANKSGSNTNVPAAALGAVGGVAALALIVFGLVMTRKRRRMREEQEHAASAGLGSKDDYYYDGASSFGPGTGGALAGAGAAGAGAGAGGRDSSEDRSLPSLRLAYPPVHPPADGSESYGWDFNTSYAAAGIPGSSSAAAAGGDSTLLAFPVPATTSDALKQQYDLANRLSVVSQDDSMLGFPLVPKSSPPQAPASATAAYALNQQMSLKQELDNEGDAAFTATSPVVAAGGSPELYYLPVSGGGSGSSPTTTPSQAFLSARGSPGITSASAMEGATTTRSSAYETVHSNSSAYATADSPSWSAASLQSHDIAIPMPPTSSGSGSASGSGSGGQQHNIQDLIRDVLRDD